MKTQKFQRQMLIYFALASLIPLITIMGYYSYTVQKRTRTTMDESYQQRISYSMDKISDKVTQINEFSTWIFQNEQLQQLLKRSSDEITVYDETTHDVVQDILRQFSYRPVSKHIMSMFIIGDNGLELRGGTDASLIDIQMIYPLLNETDASDKYWGYLTDNPTSFTDTSSVIFYRHPIKNHTHAETHGWLVMLFSGQIFSEDCADLLASEQDSVILYNQKGGVLAKYGNDMQPGKLRYVQQSSALGWTLEALIDDGILINQVHTAMRSILVTTTLICVLILLMAWYLSRNFARPIERIMRQVQKISHGDFSHVSPAEQGQNDEIRQLSDQITDMGDSIRNLMQEQLERETEKRRMEVRILQNQLNPHFLYNTLSSIKLMAALQGKTGIQNMIEALGRLLRANISVLDEEITLRTELSLIESYIYIQNAAHKGKIAYDASQIDSRAQHCIVPKFLLQPLVENAILHGIVNRPLGGTILLSAVMRRNSLQLRVLDNGAGIPDEKLIRIRQILVSCGKGVISENHSGVGLWNTAYRLYLQYGTRARVSIYSREGQGTSVVIRIPLKQEDEDAK